MPNSGKPIDDQAKQDSAGDPAGPASPIAAAAAETPQDSAIGVETGSKRMAGGDEQPPRSTHFVFDHALFRTPGARFILANDREPALALELADLEAILPIRSLRLEFHLDGKPDGEMLDKVVAGLKFVKVIRPRDSIPREILDGTASWAVQDHHVEIARGRMTLQLSSWLTGAERVIVDHDALIQLVEDPAVKERVNLAAVEIAGKLGLGPERKQEIFDRLETAAREMSYIEALRERFGAIRMIAEKISSFQRLYRRDRTVSEDLSRIVNLLRRPYGDISSIFDQIDGMSGEIVSLLRNIDQQIQFIRESRDDLHERLMLWDEIIAKWQLIEPEISQENEQNLKELYRFLARNFMIGKPWELMNSTFKPPKT